MGQAKCSVKLILSSTPYRHHQVSDIPPQAYSVDEHQLYKGTGDQLLMKMSDHLYENTHHK